jgi:methionyl-tRNA synthetase
MTSGRHTLAVLQKLFAQAMKHQEGATQAFDEEFVDELTQAIEAIRNMDDRFRIQNTLRACLRSGSCR